MQKVNNYLIQGMRAKLYLDLINLEYKKLASEGLIEMSGGVIIVKSGNEDTVAKRINDVMSKFNLSRFTPA